MDNPTRTTTSSLTTPSYLSRGSRISENPSPDKNNNNPSSCPTQHDRRALEQQPAALDIAELAKTIGNEFRGEFIVLPHHLVNFDNGDPVDLDRAAGGDDEVSSNSEDCIYAYRGDHELQPIAVDGENQVAGGGGAGDGTAEDEETDFLEMDFDEPNSEQENNYRRGGGGALATSNEVQQGEGGYLRTIDQSHLLMARKTKELNEWRERNEPGPSCSTSTTTPPPPNKPAAEEDLPVDLESDQEEPEEEEELYENKIEDIYCNDYFDHELDDLSSDDESVPLSTAVLEGTPIEEGDEEEEEQLPIIKITGTKPKVKTASEVLVPLQSPSSTNTIKSTIPHVPVPSNTTTTSTLTTTNDQKLKDVSSCLECSEMELHSTVIHSSSTSPASVCKKHCKKSRNHEPEMATSVPIVAGHAKQIQICPNILDEETIYSSFLLLGIELHRERLHQQMEANRLSLERTKSIACYLIKFTKANCDPRRFVKVIEKCCLEDAFSELDINFQSVSPEFNLIHVAAGEILSRWSSEEGLRELGRVTNKRFHSANVLGRVANLLRMRGSGCGSSRTSREVDSKVTPAATVLVPTYHRPGVLLISRRDNQTTKATLL